MSEKRLGEPDLEFIRKVKKAGGENLKKCFQCATCSVVCNLSPEKKPFPRKEMILAGWGQADKLVKDPDIWMCYQCNDCSVHCPRGAKPGDVLAALRAYTFEHYSFPSFMGKALASPSALPFLFLVPMILIAVMAWTFAGGDFSYIHDGEIVFKKFLPHPWLEVLFMGGNALIFLFAGIGLYRFWKGLNEANDKAGKGFIPSLIAVIMEVLFHRTFFDCEANKSRSWGHVLVFFGFMGAMATAGLAVVAQMGFHLEPPIPLVHPIKWLGNASLAAGLLGLLIIFYNRLTDPDKVGANGYSDWLFLIILFLTFLTGGASQFVRIQGTAVAAYSIYYVHLVVVFFLLWYAPYSKFAHMFYRTLALVYLKSIGRERRNK